MKQEYNPPILEILVLLAIGFLVWLFASGRIAVVHGAEPPRRPTLVIAIDDSPQSIQLRSELTRNWTKPNPALKLTEKQWRDVARRAFRFNAVQAEIRSRFDVKFVGRDGCPLSVVLPAVRVGRGAWETIDRRAYLFEGRPLFTVDWLRVQHEALFTQGKPKPDTTPFWMCCNAEGYSGSTATFLPPWETADAFPAYRTDAGDGCDE